MKQKRIGYLNRKRPETLRVLIAIVALGLTAAGAASAESAQRETLQIEDGPQAQPVQPAGAAPPQPPTPVSADHLRHVYESKRMAGIVMAGILAPVFGGTTAMGTYLLYRHGRDDDGGFCNHYTRDDDNDYNRSCEGDRGELSGIIVVSTVGGILTLAMLVAGATKISRSSRRLRHLSHQGADHAPAFTFAFSEKEVSFGFTF